MITFVPKLAAAVVIILVGYLIAKVVANVLNRVLERVGFDRAVERGGLKQALARSKYDPSDIIAKLAFWLIFLVALQIAFGVFGPNPISDLLQGLIAYLPNVFVAIVIIVVAAAIAKAATDLLSNLLSSVSGGQVMAKGAGIAVLVFGGFAALDQLQIAPRIVTGLWYAILAIVVGSAVVAVGGGGIKTMQRYWERASTTAEERAPELKQQAQQSASDEGNGAAVYAEPATQEFAAERTSRVQRDRYAVQTPGRLGMTPGRGVPRTTRVPRKGSRVTVPSIDTVQSWQGRTMVDPAGDKLGTIDAIYLDNETGQPEWATVTSGMFTAKTAFVPLAQAQDTGDIVQVPYDKQQVKEAPRMQADGSLSQDDEAELYRHYGLKYSEHRADGGLPAGTGAMTRSEEELRVGTETRERGRARLRKHVVTEQQTVMVPVSRIEVDGDQDQR
ncbi:MAG TPA: DUF2382 domain-containing protein [Actinomycetes bacterium]|nr:DUF2382 domain-containing protein [Actinomycetes bacterium]